MALLTGNQLKAARALVGVDQAWVAKAADVNINTIRNMEACGFQPITSSAATVQRVEACLETLGVDFPDGKDPGVIFYEISGAPGPAFHNENEEWRVRILRGGAGIDDASIAGTREMAEFAQQRGDLRAAANLRRAADRAERATADERARLPSDPTQAVRRPPKPPTKR